MLGSWGQRIFESNFGTVVLPPEVIGGSARSSHDLCAETGLCPGVVSFPIKTGKCTARYGATTARVSTTLSAVGSLVNSQPRIAVKDMVRASYRSHRARSSRGMASI